MVAGKVVVLNVFVVEIVVAVVFVVTVAPVVDAVTATCSASRITSTAGL